jgi:hypothetical protein
LGEVMVEMHALRKLFSFPDPVNDKAARTVATGVIGLTVAALVLAAVDEGWMIVVVALGFWARVLTGPTLSPLGQLATRVVAPRLGPPAYVPGPPKRFAQGVGVAFTTTAAVLWFGAGEHAAAAVVLALMLPPAFLEAAFGYCVGCKMFSLLMRAGVIPESVCEECADLSRRRPELREPVAV